MKMNRIVFAAVVVMVVALVSCGGGGGGGAPGLPGAPESISALQPFTGTVVANQVDALALFSAGWSAIENKLGSAYNAAYDDAFKSQISGGLSQYDYKKSVGSQTSVKFDVKITDAVRLTEQLRVPATIDGSDSRSWSSNRALSNTFRDFSTLGVEAPVTGDKVSSESSSSAVYKFNTAYYESGSYKVAGVVEIESNSSSSREYQAYYTSNIAFLDNITGDSDSLNSAGIVLSVSDGTKGAKFFWSYANEHSTVTRTVESTDGYSYGDLEVYNNAGDLILTVPASAFNRR